MYNQYRYGYFKIYGVYSSKGIGMHDLVWKNKYCLGIKDIDNQHKYLLSIIKKFYDEAQKESSHEYLIRLIQEISHYAQFHFCSEENIMFKSNYPHLNCHSALHGNLFDDLTSYAYSGDITKESTLKLVDFLVVWFFKHTLEEDIKFAKYVSEMNIKI